ncbi:uncharacterized protein LOC135205469 [Macrobrachium nipponense]|uniref:uncharacterized protein LOC135205469 n=1 Tax=Macrobrachium nipponense TaxID=159736 RepID=UPI0030C7B0D7
MISILYFACILLLAENIRCDVDVVPERFCDCDYYPGGCIITKAAPPGFKCQCEYRGVWTCSGTAYPCVGKEKCPGNLADHCACRLGGGDCGGYKEPLGNCDYSELPRLDVEGAADCDCQYYSGGCLIHEPAPYGWKCVCAYKSFWTCTGWAQQCSADEVCPGNDFSYCGCKNGGGDCGGYPDKPECLSPFLSKDCDCERASDWSKGLYDIEKVEYNTDNVSIHYIQPNILANKDIPNYTGTLQSISFTFGEKLAKTSTYSHSSGIYIEAGIKFVAGIPSIIDATGSVNILSNYSHTWGKNESIETMFQGQFTCNGKPNTFTRCAVTIRNAKVDVPYVMQLKHKVIPNCVCKSFGVWSGTQAYNAQLITKEVGNCLNNDCINEYEHCV